MKNLKIGIIVAALGAAAIITYLTQGAEETAAETANSTSLWKCANCKEEVELSEQDVERSLKNLKDAPPLICNKCREQKVYQVILCPDCGTKYFPPEVPGEKGVCPKCQPNAPKPEEVIEETPAAEPVVDAV